MALAQKPSKPVFKVVIFGMAMEIEVEKELFDQVYYKYKNMFPNCDALGSLNRLSEQFNIPLVEVYQSFKDNGYSLSDFEEAKIEYSFCLIKQKEYDEKPVSATAESRWLERLNPNMKYKGIYHSNGSIFVGHCTTSTVLNKTVCLVDFLGKQHLKNVFDPKYTDKSATPSSSARFKLHPKMIGQSLASINAEIRIDLNGECLFFFVPAEN